MMYSSIDFLKFFFCLCVIAIHSNAFVDIGTMVGFYITQSIFRLAVPFFFVASGFFLGKKILHKPNDVDLIYKRYIKRMLIPLLFFSVINIVLESVKMSEYMNGPLIFKEIIKHIVFYPWGALWFVQACIVGVFILYPFVVKKKLKYAIALGALLYMWALLCNNYFFVVKDTVLEPYVQVFMNNFISARNGVFVGFVYLAIGVGLGTSPKLMPAPPKTLLCIFLCLVLYLMEITLLKNCPSMDDSALYVSQLLLVPLILVYGTQKSVSIHPQKCLVLRNFSVGMYLLHRPILSIMDISGLNYLPNYVLWFVVCCVCSSICFFAYKGNIFFKKILF